MTFYLDTNVFVNMLRKRDQKLIEKFWSLSRKDIKIPSMVMAELIAGAHRGKDVEIKMKPLTRYSEMFEIVPFNARASEIYGMIWADLENKGQRIGTNDLIIASTVLAHGGILVTNNTKDFSRVRNLHLEDWSH